MHEGEGFWGQFAELMKSGPHWAFEIASGGITAMITFAVGSFLPARYNPAKRWLAKHDRDHHTEKVYG